EGDYVVGLEVRYPNGVATSSSHFEIVENTPISFKSILILILIISLIIVGFIIWFIVRIRKKKMSLRSKL
ncbi:MAG: hypothetical protein WCP89_04740, partial [archaeon]